MAPTVADIMKASGMSEEAIKSLDANALKGFETVLSTAAQAEQSAQQAKEAAELALRTQNQNYDTKIAPALDQWGTEKATMEAQLAFYKTQAEGARANGFIPQDAPGYKAPESTRTADGRMVANAGTVPGSPQYMTQSEAIKAVSNANWLTAEHMRLHNGVPPPDDIETLASEAANQRLDFRTYVDKKYNFTGRKAEIAATKQKEYDDKLRADTIAERDKYWAERGGNNPMVRPSAPSQFSDLKKAVDSKQVKDPLMMSKQERSEQTRALIHKDMIEGAGSTVN